MFSSLSKKINDLTNESDVRESLNIAIETANELITLLNPQASGLKSGEDALDDNIPVNKFPNYKAESWFAQHPYFTGERVALNFYESETVQIKFYWLGDTANKARVSAGVMLTPNWEDSDLTRNDQYKVGVDFFLSANTKSLLMAVSNSGNLRILEFSDHLSNTQQDILRNLQGVLSLDSKEQIHKTLWDALALSEVNKNFYLGIAEKFNELFNHLVAAGKNAEDSKLFASRLLGRLLFIWFLRRKSIIQEQYGYFEIDSLDSTEYYDQKLKKLFFATLNKPVSDRKHDDDKTPYLNGGLFEAHENDWVNQKVGFPSGFFSRLFEHLEQYNFTTDESTPEYEQIAIDPEMLGRVFESLLATQVTATGDQARKAKGAFYTPREIVAYMCKESLRQYLYTKLDNVNLNDGVDKLLDISDSEWELQHSNAKRNLWGEENRNTVPAKVLQHLDELSILDPACGSGAFPMGMLQLLLKTYERLDNRFDPYKTKLRIIQENIYGVDIEPMAVEISRLRAWLSLVVDDEDDNKVEPLPNLDFKFVCANSLFPLEQQQGMFSDSTLHEKLAEVRIKYFNARVPSGKDKWRAEYYKLTSNGQHSFLGDQRERQLKSFDPFKNSRPSDFFEADYMFGIPSFDILIGNPPYGASLTSQEKNHFRRIYQSAKTKGGLKGSVDTYSLFIERGHQLVKTGGVVWFIVSMSITCSESETALHDLLYKTCSEVRISSYGDRPQQIFPTAHQRVSIVSFKKDNQRVNKLYSTKMQRRREIDTINEIIKNISFVNVNDIKFYSRIPKVGTDIEVEIYKKLQAMPRFKNIIKPRGTPIYYRAAGGDFYKLFTNYSTESVAEKFIYFDNTIANAMGAILSSTLYYWYQKTISDIQNQKIFEIETFAIPDTILHNFNVLSKLSSIFDELCIKIEKNKIPRFRKNGCLAYNEYQVRLSKHYIDQIDDIILPLYGLSPDESDFIKSYELEFREKDY